MSQQNLEIVQRFYGFMENRDYSTIAGLVVVDVLVDLSRNVFNPGIHRGLDGFRHVVEEMDEMWEDFRITPEEVVDAGDTVVVGNRISGKGRASGVEAEMLIYGVCMFRDGKVMRFIGGIRDRSEAFEIAGLPE